MAVRRAEAADWLIWALLLGAPVAYDVWADRRRPQGTLSNLSRQLFHVEHPAGRLLFVAAWGRLTWWLVPHICRLPRLAADSVLSPPEQRRI
ncbi:MAG TPA: hypothetical protein VFV01_47805 [Spirillospora sp.]|nr:hypothetical protein [Spirillospora sp.]